MGDGTKRWSMEDSSLEKANAECLARMLDTESVTRWSPADEAAALRQQLEAPVTPELAGVAGVDVERLERWSQGRWKLVEVLTAPVPELELLKAVKLWARQVRGEVANPLGSSGATVIYYAAIAAAQVGGKTSLTELSEEALRTGFVWAQEVTGAEALRGLFQTALEAMEPEDGEGCAK